jgi:hypothetical protein
LVEYGNAAALESALDQALSQEWDHRAIRQHAVDNSWENRIPPLVAELRALMATNNKVRR